MGLRDISPDRSQSMLDYNPLQIVFSNLSLEKKGDFRTVTWTLVKLAFSCVFNHLVYRLLGFSEVPVVSVVFYEYAVVVDCVYLFFFGCCDFCY